MRGTNQTRIPELLRRTETGGRKKGSVGEVSPVVINKGPFLGSKRDRKTESRENINRQSNYKGPHQEKYSNTTSFKKGPREDK